MFRHGPVSMSDDSNGISITFDPIHVPGWQIGFRGIHCEQVSIHLKPTSIVLKSIIHLFTLLPLKSYTVEITLLK